MTVSFWCQDTGSFLPLAAECSVWGRQTVLRYSNQTRPGQERPQRTAWCGCEAGAIGNCLEAPASHPGCRKHRLSQWQQGSWSESAEMWRYRDWLRDWRSEVSSCHLSPWTSPDLRGFSVGPNSFVFKAKVNAAQEPSPSSWRRASSITRPLPAWPWCRSPRSTLLANIKFSERKVWAVKPALSCFQGYLCNKLYKVYIDRCQEGMHLFALIMKTEMQRVWRQYSEPPCARHAGLIHVRPLSHLFQSSFLLKEIKIKDTLEDYFASLSPVLSCFLLPS